ncbi:MAG: hypothetical protein ACKVHX_16385, partial [Alphaproteobacteria bacterium]
AHPVFYLQIIIDFATRGISFGAPSTQLWVQISTAIALRLGFATIFTHIKKILRADASVQRRGLAKLSTRHITG